MLAIIYCRVSTEDQHRHGYSIPSQLEAGHALASSLNVPEEDRMVFIDDVSGDILERPVLTDVREAVHRGGLRYFICMDPDRFSRNLKYQLIVADEIARAGTQLKFTKFDFEDTPEGRLFFSLLGMYSEFERKKIRERTMRGKLQKAKQGGLTHNPGSYGYRFDKETDKLSPEPAEAAIVDRMYRWCAEDGHGAYAIAQMLNTMGIAAPRGGLWEKATISRILRNSAYKGEMILHRWNAEGAKYNKYRKPEEKVKKTFRPESEWIIVQIPAIVDEKLWDAVQEQLARARRLRPGYSIEPYLLAGLVRCGICGSTIQGHRGANKRKDSFYRYYRCASRNPGTIGKPKCTLGYIRAEELEGEVWGRVREWIKDPETLIKEMKSGVSVNNLVAELRQTESLLTEAIKERERLLNLAQKGLILLPDIEGRLKEIKNRTDKLGAQRDALKRDIGEEASLPTAPDLQRSLGGIENRMDSMSFEERRALVRKLIEQITVVPGKITVRARVPRV